MFLRADQRLDIQAAERVLRAVDENDLITCAHRITWDHIDITQGFTSDLGFDKGTDGERW